MKRARKLMRVLRRLVQGVSRDAIVELERISSRDVSDLAASRRLFGVSAVRELLRWRGGDNSLQMARYYNWEETKVSRCQKCGHLTKQPCQVCIAISYQGEYRHG